MATKNTDDQNNKKDEPKNWQEAMGGSQNFAIWKIIAIGIIVVLLVLKFLTQ